MAEPTHTVMVLPRGNLKELLLQYFQYGWWKVSVIHKHKGIASLRHVIPAVFVLYILLGGVAVACASLVGNCASSLLTVLYGCVLALYLLGDVVASLIACARIGDLVLLPGLLVVFPAYHFSYAAGFLIAAFGRMGRTSKRNLPPYAQQLSR